VSNNSFFTAKSYNSCIALSQDNVYNGTDSRLVRSMFMLQYQHRLAQTYPGKDLESLLSTSTVSDPYKVTKTKHEQSANATTEISKHL